MLKECFSASPQIYLNFLVHIHLCFFLLLSAKHNSCVSHEQRGSLELSSAVYFDRRVYFVLLGTMQFQFSNWKRPIRSCLTINLTISNSPLSHVPRCHIYTFLERFQGQELCHLYGQSVPVSHHPSYEEVLPDVRSKPPLTEFDDISSLPITDTSYFKICDYVKLITFVKKRNCISGPSGQLLAYSKGHIIIVHR